MKCFISYYGHIASIDVSSHISMDYETNKHIIWSTVGKIGSKNLLFMTKFLHVNFNVQVNMFYP